MWKLTDSTRKSEAEQEQKIVYKHKWQRQQQQHRTDRRSKKRANVKYISVCNGIITLISHIRWPFSLHLSLPKFWRCLSRCRHAGFFPSLCFALPLHLHHKMQCMHIFFHEKQLRTTKQQAPISNILFLLIRSFLHVAHMMLTTKWQLLTLLLLQLLVNEFVQTVRCNSSVRDAVNA